MGGGEGEDRSRPLVTVVSVIQLIRKSSLIESPCGDAPDITIHQHSRAVKLSVFPQDWVIATGFRSRECETATATEIRAVRKPDTTGIESGFVVFLCGNRRFVSRAIRFGIIPVWSHPVSLQT